MKWFSSILILLVSGSLMAENFDQRSPEGWLWYKDPSPEVLKKEKVPQTPSSETKKDSYNAQLTKLRESFEEAIAKSILEPSLQNVQVAKQLHDQMVASSEKFAGLWTVSSLLDTKGHALSTNLNPLHRKIYDQQKSQSLEIKLKNISKTHGLFFAFKEGCPYCHKFVPLIIEFAEKFGFEMKGVSREGGNLPGLLNASKDNGILDLINPEGVYPALFLANPSTMEVIPVAWGMVSYTELLQNFETVLSFMENKHGR